LKSHTKQPKIRSLNTIGEALLLPAAVKICELTHGEKYGQDLTTVPLPRNTVMGRTESVSEDIKEQLQTRIKRSPKLVLQIDESKYAAGLTLVLVFARYYFKGNIHEKFMC
jgi:hypothetical protein